MDPHNQEPTHEPQPAVTQAEAAEMLGIAQDLIDDVVAWGDLPTIRRGDELVVPLVTVDEILDTRSRIVAPIEPGGLSL